MESEGRVVPLLEGATSQGKWAKECRQLLEAGKLQAHLLLGSLQKQRRPADTFILAL